MARHVRTPLLVGLALLVGVSVGAVGMMSLRGGDGPYATTPGQATHVMGAAPASTAFVMAVAGNCDVAPVLPRADSGDGQDSVQPKPDSADAPEVASLILRGKEAEAGGRQHDAEASFLNACRKAAVLSDGDPIPLADAMYQLGRLYANAGALGSPQAKPLFQRAERLYSASLEAYRARYGDKAEKTRFARQGLLTVQQATGGKAPVAIAKAAPPSTAAPAPAAAASQAAATQTVATPPVATAPVAAPVLTAKAQSAQAAATPAPARVQAWPPKPRSTMPRSRREEPARVDTPSIARDEPTPDTTAAGAGAMPHPRPQRTRAPDRGDEIALPPATASGSTGVAGGDAQWR
ncbi:hypothetical protein JJB11_24155 [Ramlibacter ginsenosidimutans]|uniref:Tetratricopeptide repeat protein n=1 Tax=Ramlibacter ginsenosidimutans TaxID=502333 RepID=A0A934TX95_9BURK|nr:hypothetical protein [Ramlibacter ginsenosidimutans]MBK6009203.1 hypothetical protein [Ramlibacter ginsenosidimutans]